MSLPISLFIILVVSFLFGRLAEKFHFSKEMGLIVAGLVLSLPLLKNNVIAGHEQFIENLAHIGLFALMFLAGFEVSWRMLIKEKEEAATVTFFTILTSLFLGFAVFIALGFSYEASLIMGVCFGVTAEATKARVLIQLKKLKTKLGALMLGAGIINDIFGILSLLIISYIFTNHISWPQFMVFTGITAAFFSGIVVHVFFNRYSNKIKIIEKFLLIFIVPLFFINLGLSFDLESLRIDYKILFIVIVVSAIGPLLGSFLTKPITKLRLKQLFLVGWGMNSKGVVELAIAFAAFQAGILPVNLYSALVITALVSTFLFQIIIFKMVRRDPGIMN
jgi:Kef-type K+ transport system membrane component KefB